jgi:7,8-dihydropterin-6-yl-methyl-4-(beta-D-ribofuranosyl)aminobenzene 5'-phosphate synthase
MPSEACEKIAEMISKGTVFYTSKSTTISANLLVTGAIPRKTGYEDTGGPFYLDRSRQQKDSLDDDQALLLETGKGLVVILGCAHAGLINTLEYAREITGLPIYAVIGGMHLRGASEKRIAKTIEALKRYDFEYIAPCHCSGDVTARLLQQNYPDRFLDINRHAKITL